jgi:hypothetical protein
MRKIYVDVIVIQSRTSPFDGSKSHRSHSLTDDRDIVSKSTELRCISDTSDYITKSTVKYLHNRNVKL